MAAVREARRRQRARAESQGGGAGEWAWIALLPWAIITLAAIAWLGPALGHALFAPGTARLWPPGWWETEGHAEPTKEARYAIAAVAPVLLAAIVVAASRWELRPPVWIARPIRFTSYGLVLALVAVSLTKQHALFTIGQPEPPTFDRWMVLAAASLVLIAVAGLRRRGIATRIAALAHETTARYVASVAIAASFSAIWLLKGIMTDRLSGDLVGWNFPYTLNDALAVLNGRTPLVDYHVIYAKLLPYVTAAALATFGKTVIVYTTFMAVLNLLTLLAVYAVFRRITRSSLLALVLFLPFVATSDFDYAKIWAGTVSPLTLSAMWPMRYGGVYLLAWLTARHLDGRWPRQVWILFFIGGLVTINNLEFGLATMAAVTAAIIAARPPTSTRAALRLASSAAAGALGAVLGVATITLARAGALPDLGMLLEWPRIFVRLGWFSMPLETWGLHVAVYATLVAVVTVAVLRSARNDGDVLLTGMLAWSGVFGLLAGGYFVGRPDGLRLDAILSAWSFALAMLTIACVKALVARGWRRPTLPQLLVLFGFGLSVSSISRLPPPQQQIARLTMPLPEPSYPAAAKRFVAEHTKRGEKVVILLPMSFRIAEELGLRNVTPYGFMNAIVTRSQMQTLLDAARRERVKMIFTPQPNAMLAQEGDVAYPQLHMILAIGYKPLPPQDGMVAFRRVSAKRRS